MASRANFFGRPTFGFDLWDRRHIEECIEGSRDSGDEFANRKGSPQVHR